MWIISGVAGNSVLATMVPVYRPLTISNTFSKRPHKPCNTSENVESGTTLGHFDIEFPILKGVNVWKQIYESLASVEMVSKVDEQYIFKTKYFYLFDKIEFPHSLCTIKPDFFEVINFNVIFHFKPFDLELTEKYAKLWSKSSPSAAVGKNIENLHFKWGKTGGK